MSLPRSQPKVSGFLNNCILHAVVPELLDAITYFADPAHLTRAELDVRKAEYEKLKQKFAEFYDITPTLTWQQLKEALTTGVGNNNTAAQLILGQVLRAYMESRILTQPESKDGSHEEKIARLCYIQNKGDDIGNYSQLDVVTASKFAFEPLGLSLICHEKKPSGGIITDVDPDGYIKADKLEVKSSVATIEIWGDGLHWERVPPKLKDQTTNDSNRMPPEIDNVATYFGYGNPDETNIGLRLLEPIVQEIVRNPTPKRPSLEAKVLVNDKESTIADINVKEIKDEKKAANVRHEILSLFNSYKKGELESDSKSTSSDYELAKKLQKEEIEKALGIKRR